MSGKIAQEMAEVKIIALMSLLMRHKELFFKHKKADLERIRQLEKEVQVLNHDNAMLLKQLKDMEASRSWKITQPLRSTKKKLIKSERKISNEE